MTEAEEGVKSLWDKLIQIIIIAVIFGLFLLYLNNMYKDDSFEKKYIAKDIALELEAIQTPQGNTEVFYKKDTKTYTISFEQGRVQVYSTTDQPQPPLFLRGISSFSIDKNFKFENKTLNYAGTQIQPVLTKTDNKLSASESTADYKLNLYTIKETNTSGEPKNYTFSTDITETNFKSFVQTLPQELNSALNTQFSYTDTNTDFIITNTDENSIIYTPQTKEKRKLANLIANKFIEQNTDCIIMPSNNNVFIIKIQEQFMPKLSTALKEAFEEYYE